MNYLSSERLGEYEAFAALTEAESTAERLGFSSDYLTSNAMLKQLLACRLGVKT